MTCRRIGDLLLQCKSLKVRILYNIIQNKFQEGTYPESEGEIQRYKKYAEDWEDDVRKNEEAVMEIKKKREHYEGDL